MLNIYVPSGIASKFLEEKLRKLQEETDIKTTVVEDLNLTLSELDKSNLKIKKTEVK